MRGVYKMDAEPNSQEGKTGNLGVSPEEGWWWTVFAMQKPGGGGEQSTESAEGA